MKDTKHFCKTFVDPLGGILYPLVSTWVSEQVSHFFRRSPNTDSILDFGQNNFKVSFCAFRSTTDQVNQNSRNHPMTTTVFCLTGYFFVCKKKPGIQMIQDRGMMR